MEMKRRFWGSALLCGSMLLFLLLARSADAGAQGASRGRSGATASAAVIAEGRALFEDPKQMCTTCHRKDLGGVVGPNLTDDLWLNGCTSADLAKNIRLGFPLKGMPPYGGGPALSDPQLRALASYILSTRGSKPVKPKPQDPTRDKPCR